MKSKKKKSLWLVIVSVNVSFIKFKQLLSFLFPVIQLVIYVFGLVVKALDCQSRGPVFKTTGGSKVDSAFHPSEVEKMSLRNFWEISGKK